MKNNTRFVQKEIINEDLVKKLFMLIDENDVFKFENFLFNNNLSLNVRNEKGESILHVIINSSILSEKDKVNFIRYIINKGLYVDIPDNRNITPLHLACSNQLSEVILYLLEKGADFNKKDINLDTPFKRLILGHNIECQVFNKEPHLINNKSINDKILDLGKKIIDELYENENIDMTEIQNKIFESKKLFIYEFKNIINKKTKEIEQILSDKTLDFEQKKKKIYDIVYDYKNYFYRIISNNLQKTLSELSYSNDPENIFKKDTELSFQESYRIIINNIEIDKKILTEKINTVKIFLEELEKKFITSSPTKLSEFDSYLNNIIWFVYGFNLNNRWLNNGENIIKWDDLFRFLERNKYDLVPNKEIELHTDNVIDLYELTNSVPGAKNDFGYKISTDSPKVVRLPIKSVEDLDVEKYENDVTDDRKLLKLLNIEKDYSSFKYFYDDIVLNIKSNLNILDMKNYHGTNGDIYDTSNKTGVLNLINEDDDIVFGINYTYRTSVIEFINNLIPNEEYILTIGDHKNLADIISGFKIGVKIKKEEKKLIEYDRDILQNIYDKLELFYIFIRSIYMFIVNNNNLSSINDISREYLNQFAEYNAGAINTINIILKSDQFIKYPGLLEVIIEYIKNPTNIKKIENMISVYDSNVYSINNIDNKTKPFTELLISFKILLDDYYKYLNKSPISLEGYNVTLGTQITIADIFNDINKTNFIYTSPIGLNQYSDIKFNSILQFIEYYISRIIFNFNQLEKHIDIINNINESIDKDYYTEIMYCVVPIINIFILINNLIRDLNNTRKKIDELNKYFENKYSEYEKKKYNMLFYIENIINESKISSDFLKNINIVFIYETIYDILPILNKFIYDLNVFSTTKYIKSTGNINQVYDLILQKINIDEIPNLEKINKMLKYVDINSDYKYKKRFYETMVNQIMEDSYTNYYNTSNITSDKPRFGYLTDLDVTGNPTVETTINPLFKNDLNKKGSIGFSSVPLNKNSIDISIYGSFIDEYLFDKKIKLLNNISNNVNLKNYSEGYIKNIDKNKKNIKKILLSSLTDKIIIEFIKNCIIKFSVDFAIETSKQVTKLTTDIDYNKLYKDMTLSGKILILENTNNFKMKLSEFVNEMFNLTNKNIENTVILKETIDKNKSIFPILNYSLVKKLKKNCYKIDLSLIEEILKIKFDVNAKDSLGQTPIYYAIELINKELIKILLTNNQIKLSILKIENKFGQNPLDYAIKIFDDHITDNTLDKVRFRAFKVIEKIINTDEIYDGNIIIETEYFFPYLLLLLCNYFESITLDTPNIIKKDKPYEKVKKEIEDNIIKINNDLKNLKNSSDNLKKELATLETGNKRINFINKKLDELDRTTIGNLGLIKKKEEELNSEKNKLISLNIEPSSKLQIYDVFKSIDENDYSNIEDYYNRLNDYAELIKYYTDNTIPNYFNNIKKIIDTISNKESKNETYNNLKTLLSPNNHYSQKIEDYFELPREYSVNNYIMITIIDIFTIVLKHTIMFSFYFAITKAIMKYIIESTRIDKNFYISTMNEIIKDTELDNYIVSEIPKKLIKIILEIYDSDYDEDIKIKPDDLYKKITDKLINNTVFPLDSKSSVIVGIKDKIIPFYKAYINLFITKMEIFTEGFFSSILIKEKMESIILLLLNNS
jgi:ankyrin repeat protein